MNDDGMWGWAHELELEQQYVEENNIDIKEMLAAIEDNISIHKDLPFGEF